MSIQIQCDSCGIRRKVNDRLAGRRVRCPECSEPIRVPQVQTKPASDVDSKAESDNVADPSPAIPSLASIESEQTDHAIAAMPITDDDDAADNSAVDAEPAAVATGVNETQPAEMQPAEIQRPASQPVAVPASVAAAVVVPADDDDDEIDEVLVRAKKPEEEMDMTPMVDVTFLLLIFFMVTAAFSLQKSIPMPRQQTEAPSSTNQEPEDETDQVELEIDERGSFLVLAADWERETPGKKNLIAALREASAGSGKDMKLKVKVHESATMKSLVDAMDAGTIAKYSPIEVTQVDQF